MNADKLRMVHWLALAVVFYALALWVFGGEPQLQTLCWKLGNLTVAGFMGYWLDRNVFWYARVQVRFAGALAHPARDRRGCGGDGRRNGAVKLAALVLLAFSPFALAQVPPAALKYRADLTREAHFVFGLAAPIDYLAGQIQQESGLASGHHRLGQRPRPRAIHGPDGGLGVAAVQGSRQAAAVQPALGDPRHDAPGCVQRRRASRRRRPATDGARRSRRTTPALASCCARRNARGRRANGSARPRKSTLARTPRISNTAGNTRG